MTVSRSSLGTGKPHLLVLYAWDGLSVVPLILWMLLNCRDFWFE